MFGKVLFFGRRNCPYTLLIKKILKKKSKKFYYIESSKINEKINLKIIKEKTFEYIFSYRSFYILKKNLLKKCDVAAINFHPGSPEFRGLGSINYAIYSGSKFYGSTAHIVNEKIDSGTIIDVKKFALKKTSYVEEALLKTHFIMYKQAIYIINLLFKDKNNLEKLINKSKNFKWSNKIRNIQQLNRFYQIKKNVSKKELNNKIRATNTKKYRPYISIKGKNFYLEDKENRDLNYLLNININESDNKILKKIEIIKNNKYRPFIKIHDNKFVLSEYKSKIKILIIGSGNHSKIILSEILNLKNFECIGFIDEKIKKGTVIVNRNQTKYKVVGKIEDIKNFDNNSVYGMIGIGLNYKRKKVAETIKKKYKNFKWATIISKNCLINGEVKIGEGSFIVSGSTINNGTIIGNHCLINTSSSIDHDNLFEDFSSTGPGVITGGQVKVGSCAHIGIGAVIKQKISIGKNALIGAKSLVLKNCLINTVYYGTPVKEIRKKNQNEKYL